MQDVAEAAGMRKASLYHHVRKKEDLLFAIHERLIDEQIASTIAAVSSSKPSAAKLREILRTNLRLIARNREAVAVFLQEQRSVTGERWETIVAKRDLFESLVRGVISEGIAAEELVDLPAETVTRGVLGMVNWSYTWFRADGPLTSDEVADVFADVALKGLERR